MTLRRLLPLALVLLLPACATSPGQRNALDAQQYAWSSAIRWGDFEGAQNLVDPAVRTARPLTALELERYKQVRISGYRDNGASADLKAGNAARDIEIGVTNVNTQAERSVRYRETWRWDATRKTWWNTSGLPDLWGGQ